MIEIDGHKYEIVFGTDVSRPNARGGVYIEMNALDSPGIKPILFAFRFDCDGRIEISMYRQDLPINVVKYFLREVEDEFARWPIVKA